MRARVSSHIFLMRSPFRPIMLPTLSTGTMSRNTQCPGHPGHFAASGSASGAAAGSAVSTLTVSAPASASVGSFSVSGASAASVTASAAVMVASTAAVSACGVASGDVCVSGSGPGAVAEPFSTCSVITAEGVEAIEVRVFVLV